MSIDTRSYELAEHFAQDESLTAKQLDDLAQTIQTAVEDWFSNLESDREAARQDAADRPERSLPHAGTVLAGAHDTGDT